MTDEERYDWEQGLDNYLDEQDDVEPTGDCDGCKFWSELCAVSIGGEPVKALCLNAESSHCNKMVCGGCDKYKQGRSIDDPSRYSM